jgi:hypothetical protein
MKQKVTKPLEIMVWENQKFCSFRALISVCEKKKSKTKHLILILKQPIFTYLGSLERSWPVDSFWRFFGRGLK